MQITRKEKIRLGMFISVTLTLAAVSLFYMVGKRMMTKEDAYYVVFAESVAGLMPGANVKLNGVNVGRVTDLSADTADVRQVIVHFVVKRGTPVKSDMIANMSGGMSITGIKTIELTGGSNEAANVPQGGQVRAGMSQMKMLTGQAEAIALKFETLLNNVLSLTSENNVQMITQVLQTFYNLGMELDSMLVKNKSSFQSIPEDVAVLIKKLEKTASRTDDIVKEIQSGRPGKKIEKTLNEFQEVSKVIHEKAKNIELDATISEFRKAATGVVSVADKLDNTIKIIQEDLGAIMANMKETSENMEAFSKVIKENPSVLLRSGDKRERDL